MGDSNVDSLCVDNCAVFSLFGGRVAQFYFLLDTLVWCRNIILIIGGNNFSFHDESGQDPEEGFQEMEKFCESVRALPHKPNILRSTVWKLTKAKHLNSQRFHAHHSRAKNFFRCTKKSHNLKASRNWMVSILRIKVSAIYHVISTRQLQITICANLIVQVTNDVDTYLDTT